jgi:uncharacterized membrane protein
MEIFEDYGLAVLSRWGHVLSGITWIGLLYYFNFVQTPSFASFEAPARNEAFAKLVPRAMWWFRWGAAATLAFGILILTFNDFGDGSQLTDPDYFKTAAGVSIASGILFALVMFGNVWLVIHPAQRRAIANARNVLAGGEADAGLPPVARKAACASRTNTLLSIPMLWFMVTTGHFASSGAFDTSEGGDRLIWWLVIVVVAAVAEFIALSSPPAGATQAWHIDNHRNTIIAGFVIAAVLYLIWEALFG